MGVFGEKHTSLTREQKRQLIHQADTHKLRPTEVCDWVQKTWGLRIARVTVYSILHKQRASLMAGHKDLYQTMQNSISGISSSSSPSDQHRVASATESECLQQNKDTGRVNKYRASPNRSKDNNAHNGTKSLPKRARSSSIVSDRSNSPSSLSSGPLEGFPGEGARWEGQLKRVREPASVELDRAMVAFLKSPASVDGQGRRLNDAELQSHALRLAQSIPSAKRMRCSFGWLRHFKRRLGVHWAADKLGRYRWIVEMDQNKANSDDATPAAAKETNKTDGEDSNEDSDNEVYHSSQESPSPRKRSKPTTSTDSEQKNKDSSSSNYDDPSILSIHPVNWQQTQHPLAPLQLLQPRPTATPSTTSSPLFGSYANVFGSLPPLHIPNATGDNGGVTTISPLATTFHPTLGADSTTLCGATPVTSSTSTAVPAAFGMSVDGKMRKVPTKDEAYEMLQSLLMYYEQDHSYIGEQQTLLLPRWIHQQRQIIQQESDNKFPWMRQSSPQQQQQQLHAHPLFPLASLLSIPGQQTLAQQQHHSFQQHLQQQSALPSPPLSSSPSFPGYHRHHSSFSSVSSLSTSSSTESSPPPSLSPALSPLSPQSPSLSPPSPFLGLGGSSLTASELSMSLAGDDFFGSVKSVDASSFAAALLGGSPSVALSATGGLDHTIF